MLRSGNQDSKLPKQNDTQADHDAVDLPCWLAIIGGIVVASHPEGAPIPSFIPAKDCDYLSTVRKNRAGTGKNKRSRRDKRNN